MIEKRPAKERGVTSIDWLDSRHTFSFNTYRDPRHMGFRQLRVINEDRVEAGGGFPKHGHRDMEILSYVLSGALEHSDSMGNGGVIRPGELQRMTAGTGITHSERNASEVEPVHFLQIWILPGERSAQPSYDQRSFPLDGRKGRLQLIGARDGRDGAVKIHQDVDLYTSVLEKGQQVKHALENGRNAWVQVTSGTVEVNGERLSAGDGAALSAEPQVAIAAREPAEVLLFDLA